MGLSLTRASDGPARLAEPTLRLTLTAMVGLWLARRLARLLGWLFRSPAALITLAAMVGLIVLVDLVGAVPVAVGVGLLLNVAVGLWIIRPIFFRRWVSGPLTGLMRAGWVYRRRWVTAMDTARLTVTTAGSSTRYVPPLVRVRSTGFVDRVRVRMLPGQTVEDYAGVADRLGQTFGAVACRVHTVPKRVHELDLWLLNRDPLTRLVEPVTASTSDLVPGPRVAVGEDGFDWRLRIVGTHVLVVGATGSGKGSVIWSLLLGLQPAIVERMVKVWVIDPKGGMELALGAPLFDRFCHGDSTTTTSGPAGYETGFADLLDDAVMIMRRRQDRLRGVTRLHQPSPDEPLMVVVIDELAALTGWVADRAVKKRIETSLGLLLSQGRAVGVVVVGAVQDPRKDVIPMRDLFPTRIALRLNEAEQVGLVLGPGARNRGAHADLIPDTLAGVGYVAVDGIAEPRRVRFAHVTDAQIVASCAELRPALVVLDGGAA
jgi:S-DNA-T family DNA segregation ATPase FtsK/SpoIIIE